MSRILVLGGTRFVGRKVVEALSIDHDVTVVSRRPAAIAGIRQVQAERSEGIAALRGSRFDRVVDFIAYDQTGVEAASRLGESYLAISSTWLPRLNGAAANGEVPEDDSRAPATMLPVTRNYLRGKARLEGELQRLAKQGHAVAAVRLPILMGEGDHTGRLDFYRRRIADGIGVLLVNGGENVAQLLWSGDAVRVLVGIVAGAPARPGTILEALPDAGQSVVEFLRTIARAMDKSANLVPDAGALIARSVESYLDLEPLWRESPLAVTDTNAFRLLTLAPSSPATWLAQIPFKPDATDYRLPSEIEYIRSLG